MGDPDPKTTINKTLSVTTLNDLQAEVRRIYDLYLKKAFDGSFTFGTPSVQHGQKVKLHHHYIMIEREFII